MTATEIWLRLKSDIRIVQWQSEIDNPQFEFADRVHDWRNHVPDEIKAIWLDLSQESRMVARAMAEDSEHAENWE